ncbi:MAG: hypothetical protein NTZ68_04120 [Candidatus Dependentiae bacterium]|nr:hypothetical protein [Candidatus Dependentiae bacterium]
MIISQIVIVLLFPVTIVLFGLIVTPSQWFQKLNPFFKIGIGALWGLAFAAVELSTSSTTPQLLPTQLPKWVGITITTLILISAWYRIYKLQKNYNNQDNK